MAEQKHNHQLRQRVEDALLSYPPLRESRSPIEVSVRDGLVELRGIVRTSTMRNLAERIAWNVPGVRGVRNSLLVDSEIERAVARRLATDERTRPWSTAVKVRSIRGHVRLKGDLPAEAQEAILQVARETFGVQDAEFDFRPAPV